ncbi:hypothetical protein TNCV_2265471 [Trichonephila clavipes]|nr:hypothetical protein TNCV_2265471 [Trichonephila clavipes]
MGGSFQVPEIRGFSVKMLSRVFQFTRREFVRGFGRCPKTPKGPKRVYEVKTPYTIITSYVVVMALLSYFGYKKREAKRELRERQLKGPEISGEEK